MSNPEDIPADVWDKSNVELAWTAASTDGEVVTALRIQISRAIMAAKAEERDAIIQECEAQKQAFLSPEYATPQPVSSICERFAIDECIRAIRQRGHVNTAHNKNKSQEV